jgi:hypothetical protein
MSTLNPLNDISRTYLDTIAKMNKREEETEVKRWEGELNLQMKTMANLKKEAVETPAAKEEKMKKDDKLFGSPNKKKKHDCASKVKHEEYGMGECIKEMHDLDENGNVAHYDVLFGHGVEKQVPVASLQIIEKHMHEHVIHEEDNTGAHAEMKRQREKARKTHKELDKKYGKKSMKEGKMAAKDYDGDGKVESGKDEYFGSRDKAIKKAMGKKSPEAIEASRRKKDKLFGSPKNESFSSWRNDLREIVSAHPITDVEAEKEVTEKKGIKNKVIINPKMSEAVAEIGGQVISETEVDLQEKQKDTPDQVKAVIAYDKARKGTDDATYDSMHGKKKQAKKERDYAKWQRDKGAEDAQKSGHRWKHAKGSTREKEGKKSETHAYIKDSYAAEGVLGTKAKGILGKEVKELEKATYTMKDKSVVKADKTDTPNYKGNKFGVKEADDWIQKAVKRPGAFTRKAKAAGQSVQQFAKTVDDNPGKYSTRTKKQANLAQTFASMKKEDVEELFYTLISE